MKYYQKVFFVILKKNKMVYKSFIRRLDAEIWLGKYRREHPKYGKNKYRLAKGGAEIEYREY